MRLWPKSLLGQVLLAIALALLVAQSISAVLLWRAAEDRREQASINAVAFRLVVPRGGNSLRQFERSRKGGERGRLNRTRIPRTMQIEFSPTSPLRPGEYRLPELEQKLRDVLTQQNLPVADLVVLKRAAITDPVVQSRPRMMRRLAAGEGAKTQLLVAGLLRPDAETWEIARAPIPKPGPGALRTIILQTLFIYLILVAIHYLLLRRITRPLAILTNRTEAFGNSGSFENPIAPEGPADVQRLIIAHNAMEARIAALLDEKDVMLGAIGHDLKTPLAALRVRIENVEDEAERGKMAAGIEDITRSLDDILTLARIGKAGEPPERAELSALLESVVEEFADRGKAVELRKTEKIVHPVYITWLKRGLRNLIGNAVRYAGQADVSLGVRDNMIIFTIDDNGPGIPEAKIVDMLEPFKRGEASRNRETGGAGLGLTIARAISEQHGGTLVLQNRPEGGLCAEIRLPLVGPAGD